MNAAKPAPHKSRRIWAGAVALLSGGNRRVLTALILVVIAILGISLAWRHFGGAVVHHPQFVATAENIEVTPQPPWVHTDVKAEVVRDGSLEKISLLDPQSTVKVYRAFSVHTWVAKVQRVYKQHPNRIFVELEYRRPVAMVEVIDQGKPGLVPVDGQGVVLPPEDFTTRTRDYLRIFAGETIPAGPVGTPWGDDKVLGAASVSAVLSSHWQKFDLYRVSVVEDSMIARKPSEITYEMTTRSKIRILWGHAPGFERAGEPTATEKLSRLLAFLEKNGPFSPENNADYDLREKAGMIQIPRTANRGLPRHN